MILNYDLQIILTDMVRLDAESVVGGRDGRRGEMRQGLERHWGDKEFS